MALGPTEWSETLRALSPDLAQVMGPWMPRLERWLGPLGQAQPAAEQGAVDGVSGVSARGPLDRLLASELALADVAPDLFLLRAATGQQLYRSLSYRQDAPQRDRVALLDLGPTQAGVLRVLQVALLLLIARRDERDLYWGDASEPDGQLHVFDPHDPSSLLALLVHPGTRTPTPENWSAWAAQQADSRRDEALFFGSDPPRRGGASLRMEEHPLRPEVVLHYRGSRLVLPRPDPQTARRALYLLPPLPERPKSRLHFDETVYYGVWCVEPQAVSWMALGPRSHYRTPLESPAGWSAVGFAHAVRQHLSAYRADAFVFFHADLANSPSAQWTETLALLRSDWAHPPNPPLTLPRKDSAIHGLFSLPGRELALHVDDTLYIGGRSRQTPMSAPPLKQVYQVSSWGLLLLDDAHRVHHVSRPHEAQLWRSNVYADAILPMHQSAKSRNKQRYGVALLRKQALHSWAPKHNPEVSAPVLTGHQPLALVITRAGPMTLSVRKGDSRLFLGTRELPLPPLREVAVHPHRAWLAGIDRADAVVLIDLVELMADPVAGEVTATVVGQCR